jgi:hypothetical protein
MLPEKEFVSSPVKTVLLLVVSLGLVGAAVLPPKGTAMPEPMRWLAGGFFGLCAIVFAWLLVRPMRLILDPQGFSIGGGLVLSPKKTLWRDVDQFFVYGVAPARKMVGFNYKPGVRDRSKLVKFSRRTAGVDGALPILSRGSPEQLVAELNDYRRHALEGEAALSSGLRASLK